MEIMLKQFIQNNVNGKKNNKLGIKSGTKNVNTSTVVVVVKNRTTNILRKLRNNNFFVYFFIIKLSVSIVEKILITKNILRDKLFILISKTIFFFIYDLLTETVIFNQFWLILWSRTDMLVLCPVNLLFVESKNNTICRFVVKAKCLCW